MFLGGLIMVTRNRCVVLLYLLLQAIDCGRVQVSWLACSPACHRIHDQPASYAGQGEPRQLAMDVGNVRRGQVCQTQHVV